jgi:Leucine-rich repeat (LRR) protein
MPEKALKLIKEAKEKRLTRLDLGNCGLTELPDELTSLSWLKELVLKENKGLSSLHLLSGLYRLQKLDVSQTGFSDLTPLELV